MAGLTTNGAAPTVDAVLRWSEVVPIYFLEMEFKGSVPYVLINNPLSSTWWVGFRVVRNPLHVLDTRQPHREDPAGKQKELQQFGDILYDMCKPGGALADKRVLLIVSGDQSHVLDHPHHDLPLGLGYKSHPYGVNPHGPAFDSAIRKWCTSLKPADFNESVPHMKEAKTCGAAGLISLERIVERLKADGHEVKGEVLCEIAPLYYGMLVSTFTWVGGPFGPRSVKNSILLIETLVGERRRKVVACCCRQSSFLVHQKSKETSKCGNKSNETSLVRDLTNSINSFL